MKRLVVGSLMGLLLGGIAATSVVMAVRILPEARTGAQGVESDSLSLALEPGDSLEAVVIDSMASLAGGAGPDAETLASLRAAEQADSLQLAGLAAAPAPAPAAATTDAAGGEAPPAMDAVRLAKLLSTMQARDAARILDELEDHEVQLILSHLRDRQAAAILSSLSPQRVAGIGRSVLRATGSLE